MSVFASVKTRNCDINSSLDRNMSSQTDNEKRLAASLEVCHVSPPLHHDVCDVDYSKVFMSRLTDLRDSEQYTDVVLKVGSKHLACHKVILAAASEYFNAMFTSGLAEANSGVIDIQGTDADTMASLLHYIYSSNIQITRDNVQSLVQASEQFQFDGLKRACEDFMVRQIAPTNCIGFYKFSKLFALKRLQNGARTSMLQKFSEVVRSTEFHQLSLEDVIEYISDDGLIVTSEDTVFEAICMWVKIDPENREKMFPKIAAKIRLPFCTSVYLCKVVATCPFMANEDCQAYLEEARMFHMLPDHRHEICSTRTLARDCFTVFNSLVIVGGLTKEDRENRYSWYLKPDSSSWELLAQMPRPGWKFYSVCVIRTGILVSGGYYNEVKKDCWLFDVSEKKWKPIPHLHEGRCKHGSAVHSGNVFILGGEDDFRLLKTVECFDTRLKRWSTVPAMPKALSDPLAVSYGRHIYVLSGIEGTDATSVSTLAYDTVWGEWEYKKDMPQPCRLGAAVALNDKLYVTGGYTRSCMSYDPLLDCWTILSLPREKHGNSPAVVWKGKILVGGGDIDSNETTSLVEEYDPESDSWSYWVLPLKEELSCHHLLNIDLFGI